MTNNAGSELKKHSNATFTTMLPKLEPILSLLLGTMPHFQVAFHLAIGFYGYAMALRQEDVNCFVEYLLENPEKYREEVVASKEFQEGFVQAFKTYLELRVEEKKLLLKNILEDFAKSENMSFFPLERLNDVLLKISPETLVVLAFIKREIIPIREEGIRRKIAEQNPDTAFHDISWFHDMERQRTEISSTLNTWIHENYNPNSEGVKKKYGLEKKRDPKLQGEIFEMERQKRSEVYAAIDELVSLGIMKQKVVSGGMGSGASAAYDFSVFGYQFVEYIGI